MSELSALIISNITRDHTFRTSLYYLTSRLLHEFGAGLRSTREIKLLESFVKPVLADISTLNTDVLIPSLSVRSW